MQEMEKLAHLLEHWAGHNTEHERNYLEWAERAEAHGKAETAEALRRIADASRKMQPFFRQAREAL